jgi:toxin ParE1/3/4
MIPDVRFHPEAELELLEAADFYDHERPGLGSDFLDEVDRALRGVIEHPESSPMALGLTRKLVLRRFPYSVMYYLMDEGIVVSSIAHQRRRPYYWRDRT